MTCGEKQIEVTVQLAAKLELHPRTIKLQIAGLQLQKPEI